SVFGHTLGWHAQQNITYLNSCLADKPIPSYEVNDYVVNYGEFDEYPFKTTNVTPKINDGVAVFDITKRRASFYLIDNIATVPAQSYTVYITVRSSKENKLPIRFYAGDATASTIPVSLDWNTVKINFTAKTDNSYVMIEMGNLTQKIEVQDLVVSHMTPSTKPQTPEEKADTIKAEMVRWVDAMMEATRGEVLAWDLINEAVSGDGNVEGQYYDLQTAATGGANDFFWQDYLGFENYGAVVGKAAREAWKKYGYTGDLKLFVNDYNLESDWDNNKKVKSMIYWVNLWNKNGATIDGIGSQMHVSYYENKATMASKAKHMVNMLHIMAESGYLVRISELDMGYVGLDGKDVKTDDLTREQRQNMANYYQFIIQMYLKIIPVDQQYSVCQWCLTDSPKGSGWRAETPVGLWTLDWNRNAAYAAYCDALTKPIPSTEDFFEYLGEMGLTHYVTPATAE
ncbi:MAG: endo-1,4-beta-xylanase, partial [Muribaculaceae bacterium]|nr:endo-1,4-beta-xylanase [Muribaculaceae bacterium]